MCCTTAMEIADPVSVTPVPPTTPQKQQHHLRRVTFEETSSEGKAASSLSSLCDEDKDSLWYTEAEIEGFRTDARLLCRELRVRSLRPGEEECVRGLEYRTNLARQERKQMTIRCIVKAQYRATNPRQLARVYRKCSRWSIVMSSIVAQNDFCAAYRLGSFQPVPPMKEYPLPFRSKYGGAAAGKRRVNHSVSAANISVINDNNDSCGGAHSEAHRQVRPRMEITGA